MAKARGLREDAAPTSPPTQLKAPGLAGRSARARAQGVPSGVATGGNATMYLPAEGAPTQPRKGYVEPAAKVQVLRAGRVPRRSASRAVHPALALPASACACPCTGRQQPELGSDTKEMLGVCTRYSPSTLLHPQLGPAGSAEDAHQVLRYRHHLSLIGGRWQICMLGSLSP